MGQARVRPISPLILSAEECGYLERQVRRHRAPRSKSDRCRIILRCADGLTSKQVGTELGFHEHTVGKWRRRFLRDRIDGLLDEHRPGRPRTVEDDQVAAIPAVDQAQQVLLSVERQDLGAPAERPVRQKVVLDVDAGHTDPAGEGDRLGHESRVQRAGRKRRRALHASRIPW